MRIISLVLNAIGVCSLALFPTWHQEVDDSGSLLDVKPFPTKHVLYLSFACFLLSLLFIFVATLWQHVAAVAELETIQSIFSGSVSTTVGATAMVLGWVAVVIDVFVSLFLWILIFSIRQLVRLTED